MRFIKFDDEVINISYIKNFRTNEEICSPHEEPYFIDKFYISAEEEDGSEREWYFKTEAERDREWLLLMLKLGITEWTVLI